MKKLTIISMAALLLLAASCKKEKKTEPGGDAVFRAITETHSGDSKTQLVNKAVNWISGDAIKVFDANTPSNAYVFTATSGGSPQTGFSGEAPKSFFESTSFTAFYPSSDDVKFEESNYKITLPDTQTYAANSFGPGANPMAAVSTTTELPFKNICGLLKLQLYAEETNRYVKSITLKSNMSDEMLWGTGTVTFDSDGIPSLSDLASGGSTLTLDCGSVKLGTSESPTVFYFVVPSGTLAGGFTVTVTDTDDKPILIKAAKADTDTKANEIQRSRITAMPALKVAPIGALPGLFSISNSQQVFFSKGNLQYCAEGNSGTADVGSNVGGTWRFAEHQFDFVGNASLGNVYKNDTKCNNAKLANSYSGWIDLFGWATSGFNHGGASYKPWTYASVDSGGSTIAYYAYGIAAKNLYDAADDNHKYEGMADWGVANAISNGGTGWRTPKGEDWQNLLDRDGGQKNGLGTIDGINGLIILPDDWVKPDDVTFTASSTSPSFSDNTYSYADWAKMESAGAIFLPAAGRRYEQTNYLVNEGWYWSSSVGISASAQFLNFLSNNNKTEISQYTRRYGLSVRLVKDAQ